MGLSRCMVWVLVSWLALPSMVPAQTDAPAREARIFDASGLLEPTPARQGPFPTPPALRRYASDYLWDAGRPSPREALLSNETPEFWLHRAEARSDLLQLLGEFTEMAPRGLSGDELELRGEQLVAVAVPESLERLERILELLEARRRRRVRLEVALVPPAATAAAEAETNARRPRPWLDLDAFGRIVMAGGTESLVLSGIFPEGTERTLESGGASLRAVDLDVNQTGVLPVLEPTVGLVPDGFFARAIVLASPRAGWYRVDFQAALAKVAGVRKEEVLECEIELLDHRSHFLGTSLFLPAGRTVIAGSLEANFGPRGTRAPGAEGSTARASFSVLLRLRELPAPEPEGTALPHVVEAGALLRPFPRCSLRDSFRRDDPAGWGPMPARAGGRSYILDAARALDVVRRLLPPETRGDAPLRIHEGGIFFRADETTARRVGERLARETVTNAQAVAIELWQLHVTRSEALAMGGAGALLVRGWEERPTSAVVAHARVLTLEGAGAWVASVCARTGIRDVEPISGGTESRQVRLAEPIPATAGAGLVLEVRASRVAGTPWIELAVEGEAARPPRVERRARLWNVAESSRTSGIDDERHASSERDGIAIDLADEDTDPWTLRAVLPRGRAMVLAVRPDASSPEHVRVLAARVDVGALGSAAAR